eukprot:644411-Prymnesium_polylepis.1
MHQVKHHPYRRRLYRSLEMRWRVCVRAGNRRHGRHHGEWRDDVVNTTLTVRNTTATCRTSA